MAKTIFITGASSGIGAACAERFAKEGARLLLCARRIDKLEALAERLKNEFGTEVYNIQLDVSDRAAVTKAINALPKAWQHIDVLVNNAGLAAGLDTVQDGQVDDWETMIDVNVKGLLFVTKALLPRFIEAQSGHIINIGSIAGHEAYPKGAVYCATKSAVNMFTKGLRLDLAGTNVRVTTVDPGAVETNFSNVRFKGDVARAESVYDGIDPLVAADIADIIYFCSSRPAHVNICELIVTPTAQASANFIARRNS